MAWGPLWAPRAPWSWCVAWTVWRGRCVKATTAAQNASPAAIHSELDQFPNLTGSDRSMLVNNVGAAIQSSQHLGDQADQIAAAARTAFVDSMHSSLWIAASLAFCAAVVAFTQLPRQTAHAHGATAHSGHHAVEHAGHHSPATAVEFTAPAEASAS